MFDKTTCNHNHVTKLGTQLYKDGFHQMHRCQDCAKIFKGELINKDKVI